MPHGRLLLRGFRLHAGLGLPRRSTAPGTTALKTHKKGTGANASPSLITSVSAARAHADVTRYLRNGETTSAPSLAPARLRERQARAPSSPFIALPRIIETRPTLAASP